MEVMRMDPIADLSSTQEYSDIDLEGDSREMDRSCSPGPAVRNVVSAAVEVRRVSGGLGAGLGGVRRASGPADSSDGEAPASPAGSSHGSSRPTSPSSAVSSSLASPQPQVNAVAPPPIRVTNFFISEILKPHFGGVNGAREEGSPGQECAHSPGSSPTRPEPSRSPSISPAKSENRSPRSDRDSTGRSSPLKREATEDSNQRRAFQVVKRKRNKSEEERNSDICKLSVRDDLEQNLEIGSRLSGGRSREFPAGFSHGFPAGMSPVIPPLLGGPPAPGGTPGGPHPIHPSLQAQLYPQLMNSRYYQQYHPYYQLYYQQYQQLQQLQRQQQIYQALQQSGGRLDPSGGKPLSLDVHHPEGEIPVPRLSGKSDVFQSSPQKYPLPSALPSGHHPGHVLRDFPESYETFRNGVSPERRSSTSSEPDSITPEKPIRNLTKTFEANPGSSPRVNTTNHSANHIKNNSSHGKSNLTDSKSSSSNLGPAVQSTGQTKSSPCLSPEEEKPAEGMVRGKDGKLWPAWVYCTRYSDRPSSGPRSRKMKKRKGSEGAPPPETPVSRPSSDPEDKRPRTAFSAEQLAKLKKEFDENRYLTEQRRQQLARDLGLNESQIKIWFQNKRAKVKKASGQKNRLALELMAQGLYNHSTVPLNEEEK